MFAAVWDKASSREDAHTRELRRRAAVGLQGRVLEVGFGTGANWHYLPPGIDYTGTEPDPHMRRRAAAHTGGVIEAEQLADAPAEALPYAGNTFDSVLATFVLCSVSDQPQAISEIARVLRPGGSFHFLEHVRPTGPKGRILDVATPLWARVAGNCHPNRTTRDAIAGAGFVLESEERAELHGLPHILGVARKPVS